MQIFLAGQMRLTAICFIATYAYAACAGDCFHDDFTTPVALAD